jgi:hypothetical protein
MKKVALLSLITLSVFIAIAFIMNPQTVNASKRSSSVNQGTALPDSIQMMVKRACMDCHATDGNFMAKGKINFSDWDKYDAAKQSKKAAAMCKVLTKGSMPPKKWCTNNPNDVPTQAEKDMVCKWASSLKK